jgi:hypothetical protein
MKPRIMYIERKVGVDGVARIGRVTYSQTGRTLYYAGREFLRIKSYKANYMDVQTREEYWISGPKKRGGDTLHGGIIHIDDDVREEYWCTIRQLPHQKHQKSIQCDGKY